MSNEFKTFLELMYSFAKQYVSWYDREIKKASNNVTTG